MSFKRNICTLLSSGCDLISSVIGREKGLRILLYHSVGSELAHDTYGISISIEAFRSQIRTIFEDERIEIVPLKVSESGSLWHNNDGRLKLAVTFDDGYKDNLYTAAPILLEYNIPFSVFVTTAFIGSNSSIYLNWEELKQLSGFPGVTIGSHGVTHTAFTELDNHSLRSELHESRVKIENTIGKRVDCISYPNGKMDSNVIRAAYRSGYNMGSTSRFGVNFRDSNPMLLKRTEVWASDSLRVFRQKYRGAWDWYGYWQRLRGM